MVATLSDALKDTSLQTAASLWDDLPVPPGTPPAPADDPAPADNNPTPPANDAANNIPNDAPSGDGSLANRLRTQPTGEELVKALWDDVPLPGADKDAGKEPAAKADGGKPATGKTTPPDAKDDAKQPDADGKADVNPEGKAADFENIARTLIEHGWLGQMDEADEQRMAEDYQSETGRPFELSEDSLKWLFDYQLESRVDERVDTIVASRGKLGQMVFEEMFERGGDPLTLLGMYRQQVDVATLDPAKPEDAEQIVRLMHTRQGMDAPAIGEIITDLKDGALLEKTAGRYKPQLDNALRAEKENHLRQREAEAARNAEQQQRYDQQLQKVLTDSIKAKSLGGVPITDRKAGDLYAFMRDASLRVNGQPATGLAAKLQEIYADPARMSKLAYLVMNDLNLETVEKQAASKANESIFSRLRQPGNEAQPKTEPQRPRSLADSLWAKR